jgi:hypothetical protein
MPRETIILKVMTSNEERDQKDLSGTNACLLAK